MAKALKVLVTGAGGFIGSHMVRRLMADGYQVVALDHRVADKPIARGAHVIEADITDAAAVCRAIAGCDTVFHFAAIVGVDSYVRNPARTMEVESVGLQNICAAALAEGDVTVVYPSSSAVYGDISGLLDEEMGITPRSNYAVAKRLNELYLAGQHCERGLRSVAVRIFNVYGPGQDERLVIPRFIRQALAGQPLIIYGSGRQTRDFIHVSDVVEAMIRCAAAAKGCDIVNAATGEEHSILELARLVVKACGSTSVVECHEQPDSRSDYEVPRSVGSWKKLQQLTGLRPSIALADGLQDIMAHVRRSAESTIP